MKNILVIICMLFTSLSLFYGQSASKGPFVLDAPIGVTNVQWYKNGNIVTGQVGSQFTVTEAGIYWAQYDINNSGTSCLNQHGDYYLILHSLDTTNTILSGPVGNTNYQWYMDSIIIPGATTSSIVLQPSSSSVGVFSLKYETGTCLVTSENFIVSLLLDTISIVIPEDSTVVICPPLTSNLDSVTSVSLDCGPLHGTTELDSTTGCVTYVPDTNYVGNDTLCIVICDSIIDVCDTTVTIIKVVPKRDTTYVEIRKDSTLILCDTTINFLKADSIIVCEGGTNGTTNITGTCFSYSPNLGYVGKDTTCYIVCNDGVCDTTIVIISIVCDNLEIMVFLEGSYNGTGMNTILNEFHLLPGQDPKKSGNAGSEFFGVAAPVGQPYSIAPYNYSGLEGDLYGDIASGASPYPSSVVDWILISIREKDYNLSSKVWECAALLNSDGSVDIPETCPCLSLKDATDYFIVVEHRNHLAVMSTAVQKSSGNLSFDFTNNQSWKLGIGSPNEVAQIQIGNKFLMYAGNPSQFIGRNDINSIDKSLFDTDFGKIFIYKTADHDLNSDINSLDIIFLTNNFGLFNLIPF